MADHAATKASVQLQETGWLSVLPALVVNNPRICKYNPTPSPHVEHVTGALREFRSVTALVFLSCTPIFDDECEMLGLSKQQTTKTQNKERVNFQGLTEHFLKYPSLCLAPYFGLKDAAPESMNCLNCSVSKI